MNAPKCTAMEYIDFLLASPRAVSGTEAARVQPERARPPAPAAFTRLLHRLEPGTGLRAVRGHHLYTARAARVAGRGQGRWCCPRVGVER